MDKVNLPYNILFHKKTNEMLYYDLLHMYLNKNKLENKVERLEKQLNLEKAMSRAWKTQVKSYENQLIVVGLQPKEKQLVKKILDEKEKVIKSLKKKLKIPITDHLQTKKLMVLQKERDHFKWDTLNFKENILQLTQEKEYLEPQVKIFSGSQVLPHISTDGITTAMSQVSLKDEEIKVLKENNLKLQ